MERFHITVGDRTTAGGIVRSGSDLSSIIDQAQACEGDQVYCPACKTVGVIVCEGPRLVDTINGVNTALDGDICRCKCDPPPRLIAHQTISSQIIDVAPPAAQPRSRAAVAPEPTKSASPSAAKSPQTPLSTSANKTPAPTCENLWRQYQDRAEAIVAPNGVLIADPKARNRAINSAYAQLWRADPRFQWAGLAAFASKQVGCGLLHAAQSIEGIQTEHEAQEQLKRDARKGFWGLFSTEERERRAKLGEYEQRQRDYEQARRNNPVPGIDWRQEQEPFSAVQQLYQHVYEMMAMGNTTLFLDVYALHLFFRERGLAELETCLPLRANIYGSGHSVLWPVGHRTLKFGESYNEILQAFQAIEVDDIAEGVVYLAWHEQRNILQPTLYSDTKLVNLLRANHLSYVTGIPSGVAQAIELTLTSQCSPTHDGRSISFSNSPFADLSDIQQRMIFVLKAAAQFNELLQSAERIRIEQSIDDIAYGRSLQ
jgi:uncharacterized Zn-binding protein involved in type VI secretion